MFVWSFALRALMGLCLPLGAGSAFAQVQSTEIQIDMPARITQGHWPVTFGVPFPADGLKTNQPVVLTSNGRQLVTQAVPLGTWDKQGQQVRWLLVDAMVDRAQADGKSELVWERHVTRNQPAAKKILLVRRRDHLIVDTGQARFRIRTRGRLEIQRVTVNEQVLVGMERPAKFTIRNQSGMRFEASGDLTGHGIEVEDHGPVRLTLRSKGWYLNQAGQRFGQHDIRLSFYADSGLVRVLHTFISTEKTEQATVTDLAMELPMQGHATQAAFGTDADDLAAAHVVNQPVHLSLLQDHLTRWDLKWALQDMKTQDQLATGSRWGGWAALASESGHITAALRDAWQNYPNEMEVRDNSLIVHFWPGRDRPLDFSTKAILSIYGQEGIDNIDKYFQSRGRAYARSIFEVPNNAMGVAKTHELWLDFNAGPLNTTRSVQLAQYANHPVIASAIPQWNAASGVVGPLHPADPIQYSEVEAALDAAFDRYVYWQQRYADYGWLDYGDIHNDARGDEYILKVKGGTIPQPWRYWDSAHYAFPTSLWRMYLRSGQRKYLEFAQANTRHCMDIDRCHYGDGKERIAGTHYYCDWSIIHWGGVPPEYVMLTHYDRLDFMLMAYYLRGDRRGLDVMRQWGETAWKFRDDPRVNFPLKMLPPRTIQHARHYGPNILNFLELYRATWDDRYRIYAADFADALVKLALLDDPSADIDPSSLGYIFEPMLAWWQLTGDDIFRRAVLRLAQVHMLKGSGQYSPAANASAFFLTGDTTYLDHGAAWLAMETARMNTSQEPAARGSMGEWAAGRHPVFMRTVPILMAAMESAPAEWKAENLPLLEKSTALYMPGPRHSTLYLQPDRSSASQSVLLLQLGYDQRATLRDASGQPLQVIESHARQNAITRIHLPAGSQGVHTLTFDLRPTRSSDDYIERGFAKVISAQGLRYWAGPSTEDGKFSMMAPRLHFRVPSGVKHFQIEVDTHNTWAAYGYFPQVSLRDPQGRVVMTKTGPGKFHLTADVPTDQDGGVWSLGPISYLMATQANALWNKPQRSPDAFFPIYFKLPADFEKVVSPRADMLPAVVPSQE